MIKKLIINADDYGLTGGISQAIIELFRLNAISNTTVMVCTQGVETHCDALKQAGFSHRAGVHLQSTAARQHSIPLSPPTDIPSLVSPANTFKPKDAMDSYSPAELEIEWGRQIQKFITLFGHAPSHLDSHHSVHSQPHYTPIYLKLAQKYQLPVRGGKGLNPIDGTAYSVPTSHYDASWTGQNASLSTLKDTLLKGLAATHGQPFELICHPGFCDEDLMQASSWNTVRENDYRQLKQLATDNWLTQNGIPLTDFQNL